VENFGEQKMYIFRWKYDQVEVLPSAHATEYEVWDWAARCLPPAGTGPSMLYVTARGEVLEITPERLAELEDTLKFKLSP
jgi:hypothetical protein